MSSGWGANWAYTVSQKDIVKVGKCKSLLKALKDALAKADFGLDDMAQSLNSYGGSEKEAFSELIEDETIRKEAQDAYMALTAEFKKQTGMGLYADYHDNSDEGDRYDEVNGIFWCVDNYLTETPEAITAKKKFGIKVETKSFVVYC